MPRQKQQQPKPCSVEGCDKPHLAQGLCSTHYQRAFKDGSIRRTPVYVVNDGCCAVEGCEKPAHSRGYCIAHYSKFRKYGDPSAVATKKTGMSCTTVGCSGVVIARGICAKCYAAYRAHGSPTKRSAWFAKRHEEIIDEKGYVLVYRKGHPNATKSSRVPKHRLVMSDYLGRPLRPDENVHHKNGDRADNSLENLELWVTAQPAGQRPLDLIAWAREILARYASEEAKLKALEYRNGS